MRAGPAAAAPSKNDTERSRVVPAPGGSHWPIVPTGSGSIRGAEAAPENGFPRNITRNDTAPIPAGPTRAAQPATAAATASVGSPNTEASAHQSPLSTPSQLSATAAATSPTGTAVPASARDSTLAFRAAPRGSVDGAGTTSTVVTWVPPAAACRATACWSSWATTGLAAEAVSSSGPWAATTTAPYTVRSSTAARAAASSR
ncbi:hypothetical protein AQJ64_11310 [Streptomyces griseoruber]|uniref:Uncharacterized protein n=1 Tax=Streptomyces griseoruber TaxID=1943 RepID=A0A117RE25_9ACTN|nr:hypothetical protein AQJ64_11310 [Streptomyces griseoruber]